MRTVAVFFGGRSNEREISIITGMLCVNLLREAAKVYPVYLSEDDELFWAEEADGVEYFRSPKKMTPIRLERGCIVRVKRLGRRAVKIDCALNCCHGGMGEDGTLSALLRWADIPLASPPAPVSALFMNKQFSQIAARGLDVPTVPSVCVEEGEWGQAREAVVARCERLGYPLIVKPSELGSSIGITVAHDFAELEGALSLAFRLDSGVLIQKYLPQKRDFNCAAYRRQGKILTSPIEEVFSEQSILTFREKYEEGAKRESELPAKIPEELARQMQEYTERIYRSFHCNGVVRADFLYDGERVYFNELNTVPGSLATYLFCDTLTKSKYFLLSLIEEALQSVTPKKQIIRTGILERGVFRGSKGCKKRGNFI